MKNVIYPDDPDKTILNEFLGFFYSRTILNPSKVFRGISVT